MFDIKKYLKENTLSESSEGNKVRNDFDNAVLQYKAHPDAKELKYLIVAARKLGEWHYKNNSYEI